MDDLNELDSRMNEESAGHDTSRDNTARKISKEMEGKTEREYYIEEELAQRRV